MDNDNKCSAGLFVPDDGDKSLGRDILTVGVANKLLDNSYDPVLLADVETKCLVYANKAAERMLGRSQREIRRLRIHDIHPKDLLAGIIDVFESAVRGEDVGARNIPVVSASGDVSYFDLDNVAVELDGRSYLMGSFRDVADRRRAEMEACHGAIRFEEAVKALPMGLHVYDLNEEGRLVFVDSNPVADRILGISHAALIGKYIEDAFPALVSTEIPRVYREVANGDITIWRKEQVEYQDNRIAGAFEVVAFQLRPGTMGTLFWDISERKKAQEEMRRLMAAVNAMGESVVITDKTGIIEYVNPFYEQLTGYTLGELKGKHVRFIKSGKHDSQFYAKIWDEIGNGRKWSGVFINRKKDGSFFYEKASISPVIDSGGNIVSYVAVKLDVTHEYDLEQRVMRSQKMAALGQFAHRVSHDITNCLSTIMGSTELLMKTIDDEDSRSLAVGIIDAVERMGGMTSNLMAFANPGKAFMKRRRLDKVIESMRRMIDRACYPNAIVKYEIEEGLYAEIDENQMEQAVMHVVVNATEALSGAGEIKVRLYRAMMPPPGMKEILDPNIEDVQVAVLEIADTGEGLTEDECHKAFDPFYTTKRDQRRNAGLGLATVYGIISRFNGDVTIKSEKGAGAVVKIILPLAD